MAATATRLNKQLSGLARPLRAVPVLADLDAHLGACTSAERGASHRVELVSVGGSGRLDQRQVPERRAWWSEGRQAKLGESFDNWLRIFDGSGDLHAANTNWTVFDIKDVIEQAFSIHARWRASWRCTECVRPGMPSQRSCRHARRKTARTAQNGIGDI